MSQAHAQTFSLSVSPPIYEVMVKPGKSLTQTYTLINQGDNMQLTASVLPFTPGDEFGHVSLQSSFDFAQDKSAIQFSFDNADIVLNQPFSLYAQETKQIVLKIKVPENAPEDDYYFTLLFNTNPTPQTNLTGTSQAGAIGTNLLLTVSKNGQPPKKGEILTFSLKNPHLRFLNFIIIDSFTQPEFFLRLKNTGRAYWQPLGKLRGEGPLGPNWEQDWQPANVLTNSVREIELATPSATPHFFLGPYQVKTTLTLDDDGPEITGSFSFLALPGKVILAVFVAVALMFTMRQKRS